MRNLIHFYNMRLLNDLFVTAARWIFDNYPDVPDQKTLAIRTGITETTLSRIFNDKVKRPSALTIKRLTSAFEGVFNPDYFIARSTAMLMVDLIYYRQQAAQDRAAASQSTTIPGSPSAIQPLYATVPEASAPAPTSSIPDWADSLIHLASDNAAAIQDLKAENQHLRDLLNEVLTTNKKLREELTKVLYGVNPLHHEIKYQPSDPNAESIPMAAELKK